MTKNNHQLGLHVHVITDGQKVLESQLTVADTFTVSWTGTPTSTLRKQVTQWLEDYLGKNDPGPCHFVQLPEAPPFHSLTWSGLQKLSFGELATYGELARTLGRPRSARAVGQGCGANPLPLFIPCHRVVRTGGALGGFREGLAVKECLLQHETSSPHSS